MNKNWQRDSALRDLFAVVTVSEAIERWGKHNNTVRYAMAGGKLDIRLSGGVWLITVDSLIRLWGKPIIAPDLNSVEITLPRYRRVS